MFVLMTFQDFICSYQAMGRWGMGERVLGSAGMQVSRAGQPPSSEEQIWNQGVQL